MDAAKTGSQPLVVYSGDLEGGRTERFALVAELQQALERGGLHVVYQPKLDLGPGTVSGVEALVRWTHPHLGPLSPDAFIPLAESTGLIYDLTRHVLSEALQQVARWRADGLDLAVSVNLSARNVTDERLPELVAGALAGSGVPADRLTLEITESSVMGDRARALPVLNRLAELGVTLSLDDFGTGHSSLSYLQSLPVQEIKIDKSFVQPLAVSGPPGEGQESAVLVQAIVTLARNLRLRVVAEGVEEEAALAALRSFGCDTVQGYLIGRPESAERVAELLSRPSRVPAPRPGGAHAIEPSGP
jgi:EAL domain-containing protein (putative c-di-GMP-specific phosphodiesterase class I)